MSDRLRPKRAYLLGAYDCVCWIVGLVSLALLADLTSVGVPGGLQNSLWMAPLAAFLHLMVGKTFKLHEGRASVASFEDVVLVSTVHAIVAIMILVLNFWSPIASSGYYMRTLVLLAGSVAALILMLWGRAVYRIYRDRALSRVGAAMGSREPVVVIGAGGAADQLIASMFRDPRGSWLPIALVDDDPMKRNRRMRGVSVRGSTRQFAKVARAHGARSAVLAIPSASAEFVRQMETIARDEAISLKVLPSLNDLRDPFHITIRDIRDIDATDLLGRHVIDTDVESIAGYLSGKRVLVTGAGGSIGSELCRQIAKFEPSELIMLDRDESALHAVELSIHGKAMLDTDETVLGDIRDIQFMMDLFARRRPNVVFHAAALKHMPLLEKAPGEAIKTNVWGTLTVLEAANAAGVQRFVNVSTDKAANPSNVLGYSKRLAEGLTTAVGREALGTYLSVRFGNVLGSRGSVLTAFAKQIAEGGPVTVTHPDVGRYFMTIREAVQLVIQAGAIGGDGEVLVLDMGEEVQIRAVAEQLIELSGKDIEIVYTGLRPGEKMHEELLGEGEEDLRPRHPLITQALVPPYDPLSARSLDPWSNHDLIAQLASECSDMKATHEHWHHGTVLVPRSARRDSIR